MATESEYLMAAVRALISDIESMSTSTPRDSHWFGPFSTSWEDAEGGTSIEWPNLAISLDTVKKLLEPKTIEHQHALDNALLKAQGRETDLALNQLHLPGFPK